MEQNSQEKQSRCCLLNAVFGQRSFWPRRATSTGSIPGGNDPKTPGTPNSRRRRVGSDDSSILGTPSKAAESLPKPVARHTQVPHQAPPVDYQNHGRRPFNSEAAGVVTSSAAGIRKTTPCQGYVNQGKRVPKDAIGISGELESIIVDHQKNQGGGNLVRASSSNVMIFGNLGNLRRPGGGNVNSYNVVDYIPKTAREESPVPKGNYANSVMGNVVRGANREQPDPLCRAISTRMDPETLKIMGNEDYKSGRFAEALALYDAAIAIDPNKPSYRSNKSAALAALGRLFEAVFECREAIRIEPQYHRAHHRLATLYFRLGEAEKALYHFKHAGPEADQVDIAKVKTLQAHLNKCTEARKLRDWNTLIKETGSAISAGADSAPQIFAFQAEGLLKLHRHQDADDTLLKGPNFEADACTRFLGPIGSSYLLVIRAQVDMAAGRLDDAMETIQRAARLDSNNREANVVMKKAKAVAAARAKGNELFKASRFPEASAAYEEGLEHDPYNSVLLCNRAACLSKLGQFERALEDCTAALIVRPSYSKARLRRADCNAKLEKWEASIQDYEVLLKETPGDEEARQGLLEAREQLKKQRGGH
ncbi:inactive TPR repeat-containing thioredoxin TTL3-like [Juglans microcarpa x Juglans regia]|uniref:inactive TPR repeat-containing thioredoxin TTL3-like n=1 Tax=Juglans microcarpa x Juglans regia TaxID=2249226 RepID=UPI001B7EBE69|nr:inactive TPR repeat-containing thioredoxin TTL3-like [Juglans microcarpa x Juglans regia]